MKHLYPRITLVLAGALLLQSCATILTGNKQIVQFNSFPEGATVSFNGKELGKTPLTVKVKRSLGKREAKLKLEGYPEQTVKIKKSFNPYTLFNALNYIGLGVDALTGAMVNYSPMYYEVPMKEMTEADKSKGRNLQDNFYIITNKDTLYIQGEVEVLARKIEAKLVSGEKVKIKKEEVKSYRAIVNKDKMLVTVFLKKDFCIKEFEGHPHPKHPKQTVFMEVMMVNKDYKLLKYNWKMDPFLSSTLNSTPTYPYGASAGVKLTVVPDIYSVEETYYYIYKNGQFYRELEKDNCKELLETAFGTCTSFASDLAKVKKPLKMMDELIKAYNINCKK